MIFAKKYLNFFGLSKNNGGMKTNNMGDMRNTYCIDYNNCYVFTTSIPTMDDFPCEGGDVNISGCKENTKEKINIYRILKTGILITAIAGGEKQ